MCLKGLQFKCRQGWFLLEAPGEISLLSLHLPIVIMLCDMRGVGVPVSAG